MSNKIMKIMSIIWMLVSFFMVVFNIVMMFYDYSINNIQWFVRNLFYAIIETGCFFVARWLYKDSQ